MEIAFKFKPKGASQEEITAEIVDVIAWEEQYQKPITSVENNPFVRDLVWLAWHAMKRSGRTSLEFMDWVATLEDIEQTESVPLPPSENPAPIG